jgi:hypothetical protein
VPTVAPKILRIVGRKELGVKGLEKMRLEISHQKAIVIKLKSLLLLKYLRVRFMKLPLHNRE